MDAIRTGLQICSTLCFLVGCTVAAIVYVSSNANNSELAVMKLRIQQLETGQRLSMPYEVRPEPKR